MVDIIDMKQRVAATKAKLKAANAEGEKRGERLLRLLDAVEQIVARNEQDIRALRQQQAAAAEEIQQLRNLLQVMLTLAESSKASRPSLPHGELESLIERLNEIVAAAAPSAGESARETEAEDPSGEEADGPAEPAGEEEVAKAGKKSRGKKFTKILTFFVALGWIAAFGAVAGSDPAPSAAAAFAPAAATGRSLSGASAQGSLSPEGLMPSGAAAVLRTGP